MKRESSNIYLDAFDVAVDVDVDVTFVLDFVVGTSGASSSSFSSSCSTVFLFLFVFVNAMNELSGVVVSSMSLSCLLVLNDGKYEFTRGVPLVMSFFVLFND